MKKLELVKNGNLIIKNCKKPRLKKGHSLIKIGHVGACSSDIARGFSNGAYFYPLVMGHEAMGYVENEFSKKNTKVFLEVRGKKHPANICSLPFYKKSYVKGANK